MSHKIICAIQDLQKGYYVRSSPNVSDFPSKNPRGFDFSIGEKKKLMFNDFSCNCYSGSWFAGIRESFSSWKYLPLGG